MLAVSPAFAAVVSVGSSAAKQCYEAVVQDRAAASALPICNQAVDEALSTRERVATLVAYRLALDLHGIINRTRTSWSRDWSLEVAASGLALRPAASYDVAQTVELPRRSCSRWPASSRCEAGTARDQHPFLVAYVRRIRLAANAHPAMNESYRIPSP